MPDYPSLLNLGFHAMSITEIEDLCVKDGRFKNSPTRPAIMAGLQHVVAELQSAGVDGDLWVDGSFLTEKIDPKDTDVVLHVSAASFLTATPAARAAMKWLGEDDLKTPPQVAAHQLESTVRGELLRNERDRQIPLDDLSQRAYAQAHQRGLHESKSDVGTSTLLIRGMAPLVHFPHLFLPSVISDWG